ncbi:uncharacterized protein LOC122289538 [Carya illinoinensis]|uniref:uncharacterized protein LOC122289538 n=1 Tax=Carya illinoinensis TaxID=32201 RepID=UPI001C72478A|nr:uncharacterized protein LOC122289538 [Carya illinoinensis]
MVNNLQSFTTAKEMWDYFRRVYYQDNTARKFQVELEISNYKQGNLSIEQFYARFLNLWSKHSGIVYSKVPKAALEAFQVVHAESQRDQFLMKLRPKFETARAGLINRNPVPSLDVCLGKLLREEQRLATQHGLTQETVTTEMVNVAYAAQGKGRSKTQIQCFSCKEFGHITKHCSRKFCNYCKKEGHIIKDSRVRPQNRQSQGFHTAAQVNFAAVPFVSTPGHPPTAGSSSPLTPTMVQQMIASAFSALGLQGSSVGKRDSEGA